MVADVTLTHAQQDEIEAREKAATPGPWVANGYSLDQFAPHPEGNRLFSGGNAFADDDYSNLTKADIDFIAHARADVPTLIAALRASRERERRYETAGRTWIQGLDLMRSLTVHDPRQNHVVNLMTEAEKQMRAALGEEAT